MRKYWGQWQVTGLATVSGVLMAGSSLATTVAPAVSSAVSTAGRPAVQSVPSVQMAQLPLQFERNQGQSAKAVDYLARGKGYSLFLSGQEAVLKLHTADAGKAGSAVVRARLVGAHAAPVATGEDALASHANYFVGRDSRQWQRNVPEYGRVRYQSVYDGVDLVYYGNQQQLEYDFVVAPGADPDQIQLRYSGIDQASIDADGNLHLHSAGGDVVEHKPVVYQMKGGQREAVAGRFKLESAGAATQVAFALDSYDKSRPLVIDPVLVYSSCFGGSNLDYLEAMTVDSSGSVYITGRTYSSDYPVTSGAVQTQPTPGSYEQVYISKLSADGSSLVYSTYLGGSEADEGYAIAVDGSGAAYVAGLAYSTDFPTTAGAFQAVAPGPEAGFVSKLSADGSQLVYSTYLGGSNSGYAQKPGGIAIDANGDAFIHGISNATDFPVTAGAYRTTAGANAMNFVSKLNPAGSALLYSTFVGDLSSNGQPGGILVDAQGNAYLTGSSGGSDYPVTAGAFQTQLTGYQAGFLTKLKPDGSGLLFSSFIGGSGGYPGDSASSIAMDASGSIYLAGTATSTDFPTTAGAFQSQDPVGGNGNDVGFISKFKPDGSGLVYSTYLGGSELGSIASLAIDAQGEAYVTGQTFSFDYPVTPGALQTQMNAGEDAVVSGLSADGSALVYSTYLNGNSYGSGIAVDNKGTVYVAGYASWGDMPITTGAYQSPGGSSAANFIAKIANVSLSVSPTYVDYGTLYVGGKPGTQAVTLTNSTAKDAVLESVVIHNSDNHYSTNCGKKLAAGSSCNIQFTWAPTTPNAFDNDTVLIQTSLGTVETILFGYSQAKQVLSVTGTGSFGRVVVGTTKVQDITLSSTSVSPVVIKGIATYGAGFSQTNNCPSALKPGAQCTIAVTFAPTAVSGTAGTSGKLVIANSASSTPTQVQLQGRGVAPN